MITFDKLDAYSMATIDDFFDGTHVRGHHFKMTTMCTRTSFTLFAKRFECVVVCGGWHAGIPGGHDGIYICPDGT